MTHAGAIWRRYASPAVVARLSAIVWWTSAALLLVAPAPPAVADISVSSALNTQTTQVGQAVTLTIVVAGAQNVEAPALNGLDDFVAQYIGPSTQVSIVNGQMNTQVQHNYALTPRREGPFTLGPFTVNYGGQQYQTQPLRLTVTSAAAAAQAPASGQGGGEQLRLVVSVAKNELYLHEPLPIDITLYVGSIQVADVQYPAVSAEGLSLDAFGRPRQFGQMIEGRRWDAVEFHTNVIPLQDGTRVLGPATMRLNIIERQRQGGFFNDPFFNAFASRRRAAEVRSDPIELKILPLPEEGKPAAFSGAVGKFTMQVSAVPTELRAGDPVTLKIAVRGNGNLADAKPPAIASAAGFKIYEPQVANPEGDALRVFEQVLIPKDQSVTSIPAVHFAYFDPESRSYQTVESAPIALAVRPGEPGQQTRILGAGGEQRVMREQLGRDIVYIKDEIGIVRSRATPWYRNWLLWLCWPIPPLLFAAAVAYDRRRQRLSGDVRYARFTQARRSARRGLALAEDALKRADPATFYDHLSRTMQSYLSDKLGLPPGAIGPAEIAASGVSADNAERLRRLFEVCEHVRFAPSSADGDMRGALAQAKDILSRIEKERTAVPTPAERHP